MLNSPCPPTVCRSSRGSSQLPGHVSKVRRAPAAGPDPGGTATTVEVVGQPVSQAVGAGSNRTRPSMSSARKRGGRWVSRVRPTSPWAARSAGTLHRSCRRRPRRRAAGREVGGPPSAAGGAQPASGERLVAGPRIPDWSIREIGTESLLVAVHRGDCWAAGGTAGNQPGAGLDRARWRGSRHASSAPGESGPVGRLLWSTSAHTTMSVATYGIYALTNAWFVSRGVGPDALVAVNVVTPVLLILGAVSTTVGVGGASMVSRSLGAGNTFLVYWASSIAITTLGLLLLDPLLTLLGARGEVRGLAAVPVPVIAEGRIAPPEEAAQALAAGGLGVVVGAAITVPAALTRTFVAGLTS
ncbi:MATE family efflux transporter [Streptomyces clavifer]|uniref:MATE family efflux transporter n=1 Tax=Streptomyces clavifer TaxID=68188 RepID=UPI00380EED7A